MESYEEKKLLKLLQQVDDLHEKGILDDSVYEAKKQELISRLYKISHHDVELKKPDIIESVSDNKEREATSKEKKTDYKDNKTDIKEEKPKNTTLIKCPDCGREVSRRAEKCIHCGCPIATPKPTYDNENFDSRKFRNVKREDSDEPQAQSAFKAFITGGLRKCPSCGKPIAQNSKRCPYCGRRDPFIFSHMLYWLIVLIVFMALFGFFKK